MSHSERKAAVSRGIVNVFAVESQGNMLAPAANPRYLVILASTDTAGDLPGVVSHYFDSSTCRSRSVSS
jgi:hypothetical protein